MELFQIQYTRPCAVCVAPMVAGTMVELNPAGRAVHWYCQDDACGTPGRPGVPIGGRPQSAPDA
jgi:hypothetical protein